MSFQPRSSPVLTESFLSKLAASVVLLLLVPLTLVLIDCFNYYRKPCNLPALNLEGWQFEKAKQKYIANVGYYLRLGREKFRNQPILLWGTEGYITVLPESFVEELKGVDDSVADNLPLFTNIVSNYDWIDLTHNPVLRRAIQSHLTPKLAALMPVITDELEYALQTQIPTCQDWTSININRTLLHIISLVSGRIFVGLPLNRDEEWTNACINYTLDLFNAGRALRAKSYWGKVLAVKLGTVPEVVRVDKWHKVASKLIVPIIEEREIMQAKGLDAEIPEDMITWIMEQGGKGGSLIPHKSQAMIQLLASLAAIHTTTLATTNFMYDLVARPEYLEPLREEIDTVWDLTDGLDKTSMSKLIKLDSFLKESQRLNPHNDLSFDRAIRAKKGVTLSNGLHLRRGAKVAVAANQLALDPTVWENPSEFHGFRFADLRTASKENANKFQFATTNPANSMYFGHGRHDCPGRFFAANEIKTIMAYFIRKYDFKAGPNFEKRPDSFKFASRRAVNPNVDMMIKKREGNY